MNSQSSTATCESYYSDSNRSEINDGVSENSLNLALFALCILFLGLSMISSSLSLYELEASRLESHSNQIQKVATTNEMLAHNHWTTAHANINN